MAERDALADLIGGMVATQCSEERIAAEVREWIAKRIRPHRWDKDYPQSAHEDCWTDLMPDSFYAGVLHAVRVVSEGLPVGSAAQAEASSPQTSAQPKREPLA